MSGWVDEWIRVAMHQTETKPKLVA